jgi:hypothetical protein
MEGLVDESGFRFVRVAAVECREAGADVDHATAGRREGDDSHLAPFAEGFTVSVVEAQQAEVRRAGLAEKLEGLHEGAVALVRELGKEPLARCTDQAPPGARESLLERRHIDGRGEVDAGGIRRRIHAYALRACRGGNEQPDEDRDPRGELPSGKLEDRQERLLRGGRWCSRGRGCSGRDGHWLVLGSGKRCA